MPGEPFRFASLCAVALLVGLWSSGADAVGITGTIGGLAFAEVGTQSAISKQDQDQDGPGPLPVQASIKDFVGGPGSLDRAEAEADVFAQRPTPFSFFQLEPVISLSASAISNQSDQPDDLPFASATGSFADKIGFCVVQAGGCTPYQQTIGGNLLSSSDFSLVVTMTFAARVDQSALGPGLPPFTGFLIGTSYGGGAFPLNEQSESSDMSGASRGLASGGSIAGGSLDFTIPDLTAAELSTDEFFSFDASITDSPFQFHSEDVTFQDPVSFTVLDPDGNVVTGLSVNSEEGMFYAVTGGAASLPAGVPEPASGVLCLAGLAGFGFLKKASSRPRRS